MLTLDLGKLAETATAAHTCRCRWEHRASRGACHDTWAKLDMHAWLLNHQKVLLVPCSESIG
jgi:hypothetical protein